MTISARTPVRWRATTLALAVALLAGPAVAQTPAPGQAEGGPRPRWAIALHGGAGFVDRARLDSTTEAAYRAALARALAAGAAVLERGGPAMDAVQAVIEPLEDDALFNAGRGAVFSVEGRNELDAAVMDGATGKAGAVAGVTRTRHPVALARAVMERSPHVMLAGPGADSFAADQKLEQVQPGFFFTERRWGDLVKELRRQNLPLPPRPAGAPAPGASETAAAAPSELRKLGTVGVAVLDSSGHVAAGTSTGGINAKRWGRIGDAPIIGAGTYAADRSCAVSATGAGEYFIRLTVAREVCALVEYRGLSLQAAADEVVQRQLKAIGGDGGVVAVSPRGEAAFSFNTPSMFRARQVAGGEPEVAIWAAEDAR